MKNRAALQNRVRCMSALTLKTKLCASVANQKLSLAYRMGTILGTSRWQFLVSCRVNENKL